MAVIPHVRRRNPGRRPAAPAHRPPPTFRVQRAMDTARARGETGTSGFPFTAAFLVAGIMILLTMMVA